MSSKIVEEKEGGKKESRESNKFVIENRYFFRWGLHHYEVVASPRATFTVACKARIGLQIEIEFGLKFN